MNQHVLAAAADSRVLTVAVNVSCYAPLSLVDKVLFDVMVLGHLTPEASGDVFAVPLGCKLRLLVEIPNPVDTFDDQAPLAAFPGSAADQEGIISHLTMLRDAALPHHVADDARFYASPGLERTLRCGRAQP